VEIEMTLALKSAILAPNVAKNSWNQLMDLIGFENLNNSSQRILPKIYINLENEPEINSYEKLKGAYKFNWAKNNQLLNSFLPVLKALNVNSVDYRLLKGAALNLLSENIGHRAMGDIDLLIEKENLSVLESIFVQNGFQKKYDTKCINSSNQLMDREICYLSPEKFEIDVHVAEKTFPQLLYRKMMKSKAQTSIYQGEIVKLPSFELALLHTVYHGNRAVAETDLIQTYVDCCQLLALVNLDDLNKIAHDLKFVQVLSHTIQMFEALRDDTDTISKKNKRIKLFNLSFYFWSFTNKILNSSDLFTIIKTRSLSKKELRSIYKFFEGQKIFYFIWLLFGKPRPFERFICLLLGGFLDNPKNFSVPGNMFIGFKKSEESWYKPNLVSQNAHDWRFKVKVPKGSKQAIIEMIADEFKNWNWLIFINGRLFGTTTQIHHGTYVIRYSFPPENLEISLRSPAHVCALCERGIENLLVRVHS
jgi:hypothetical protein